MAVAAEFITELLAQLTGPKLLQNTDIVEELLPVEACCKYVLQHIYFFNKISDAEVTLKANT